MIEPVYKMFYSQTRSQTAWGDNQGVNFIELRLWKPPSLKRGMKEALLSWGRRWGLLPDNYSHHSGEEVCRSDG